jgi:hypothetical protein
MEEKENASFGIEQVIAQVKDAVKRANVVPRDATSLAITKLTVTLQVVQDLSGGANATFKVPVIGLDVGGKATYDRSATSTITLNLVAPPPVQGTVQGLVPKISISDDLVEAIAVIRAGMLAGAIGAPAFEPGESTVEISFGVTVAGGISLVAAADRSKTTTQTLILTLAPNKPANNSRPPAPQ